MDPENMDVHTWVHAAGWSFIVRKQTEPDEDWPLGKIMLYMNGPRNSMGINLTNFREDELRAIAYAIQKALELALPMTQDYDVDTQRRYDEGESFQLRIYRSVPVVLSVEGYEQGDGEGIQERPAPVALEYRGPIHQQRVRKSRRGVAHRPPKDMETTDYIAEDHDDPNDRQVPPE
jgi:hypothetical protein